MGYTITPINPSADSRWDSFVLKHPMGSVYHRSSWINLVASTFPYRPNCYALIEKDTGSLKGVLPLMVHRGLFKKSELVAVPYATYCEPLVPSEMMDECLEYVLRSMSEFSSIELRLRCDPAELPVSLQQDCSYINHTVDLSGGIDTVYSKFHNSCVKRKITKAQKSNISFHISSCEKEIKSIYELLLLMRKTKGLPPHPYKFFVNLWNTFEPLKMFYAPYVSYKNKIICAAIILKYKDTIYYEYAASDPAYQNLGSNQYLIWEIIKFGIAKGAKKLDLGRSHPGNDSLIQFKDRWGGKKTVLSYCHYPKYAQKKAINSALVTWGEALNRRLPVPVLRLEGEFIYRFLM